MQNFSKFKKCTKYKPAMKAIRKTFGLTQKELAGFLGLTRSQLSVAESAGRRLPEDAAVKCSRLMHAVTVKKGLQQLPAIQKTQQQELQEKLRNRKNQAALKATQLRYQLKKMKAACQQCTNALLAVQELLPGVPEDRKGKRERLWLELLQLTANNKLNKCGPAAQQLLQLETDLLDAEVEMIGRLLK